MAGGLLISGSLQYNFWESWDLKSDKHLVSVSDMSSRTSPFGNITIHCPRYKGNGRWKNFSHFSHKTLELVPVHIRFSASIRLCWLRWFSHFITFIYLFNIYFYFLFSFIYIYFIFYLIFLFISIWFPLMYKIVL